MNSRIQFTTPTRRLVIALMVLCFGLLPQAQAVSPPPDGGYPGNNTAEGTSALFSLSSGVANTALGFQALYYNTTSSYNTVEGFRALFSNTTGAQNTATGSSGLLSNTTGSFNTANGVNALYFNTTGTNNTASGARALFDNVGGIQNTAVGALALFHSTGSNNTALGFAAAYSNDYSHYNTGFLNTAIGANALAGGDGGSYNTAIGASALAGVTTFGGGNYNTAVGFQALLNGNFSNNNIALGAFAGTNVYSAEHVICIDAAGANVSNTTWIGSVYGVTTQSGTTAPVVVSDTGQLGTVASSERFKKDISTMEKASDVILALRPVTFHYKSDAKGTPQFGLIAEEVAKVNPALVLPDKEGKPYTVRYDAVNAMLLNEFLKEHRKVKQQAREMQEQQATIAELKSDAAKQEATISQLKKEMESVVACLKEHDSRIQKVSAQIELSEPFARTALNNQ
jgi:hypothetical protein